MGAMGWDRVSDRGRNGCLGEEMMTGNGGTCGNGDLG